MSTTQSEVKCKQCGFPGAWEVFDCRSNEWTVDCFRCGYHESLENESFFSNGHLERAVNKVLYAAGALCVKYVDSGISQHRGLAEADVEQVAAKVRDCIASGKLSPESYVTKYNFETREVTSLVGQVPFAEETQMEKELNPVTR
jgi:hypothetical protein